MKLAWFWVLGASLAVRAEDLPPPQTPLFYEPESRTEEPDSPDLALAVVVASRFPLPPDKDRIFGNGVLIEGAAEGTALVLTCAHLVRRESTSAFQTRVGVFRTSFESPADGTPDYQEFEAHAQRLDEEKDLALLEICVPSALKAARVAEPAENDDSTADVVSIVPFGSAGCRSRRTAVAGQSGSPGLRDGVLLDLVRGSFDWLCSWSDLVARVDLDDIRGFLELGAPVVPCVTGV